MNSILADSLDHSKDIPFVLNTAVEATTLTRRAGGFSCCCLPSCGELLEQDTFIRDNLKSEDYLVVSIGGNDIALAPR